MEIYFTHDVIQDLIIFQAVVMLVLISNLVIIHRARQHAPPKQFPLVSILVPARNEEKSIARCVRSLLAQDYPSYEILVLDDHSTDATPTILTQIAAGESRLQVLTGKALPNGWLGKNWACTQLAAQAKGDLLLFTDADTHHRPETLSTLVTSMIGEKADLMTGLPGQQMESWGERFMVPFFLWAFVTFTPLALAYRLKLPFLANAVGQLLLFRRSAYQAVGGHTSVHGQIAEDISLAREITAAGFHWRVINLTDLISSRMYSGGKQAFQGFSKNYFAAFDFRLLPYLFVYGWLALTFFVPPVVLMLSFLGFAPLAQPAVLTACIALSILLWVIPYGQLRFGIGLALLYPITLLVIEVVVLNSLRLSLTGQLGWKDRELDRPQLKLFLIIHPRARQNKQINPERRDFPFSIISLTRVSST